MQGAYLHAGWNMNNLGLPVHGMDALKLARAQLLAWTSAAAARMHCKNKARMQEQL